PERGRLDLLAGLRLHGHAVLDALEREGEAPAVGVHLEDPDVDLVALRDDLARVLDVMLRELGDVDEPLDARQDLDEGAEGDDVRDRSFDDVAGVEPVEDPLPLLLALLLEHGAARQHDVVARAVQLDDLAQQLLAEELVEVLHAADVDERCGQEAAHAQVEDEAALDDLDHTAGDRFALLVGALDRLPRDLEARALLRQDQPALGVLLRQHERGDVVADRDLVLGVDRAPDRKLRDRDDPLRLVADVDEHLVLVDSDDGAVHDLSLLDGGEG